MTTRPKSYFSNLSLRELIHELLTNTSEAVVIRAAINDLLVRRNTNLYDLIRSDGNNHRQVPSGSNLTGIEISRMKTTKEVADACVAAGFDAAKYSDRIRDPQSLNFYIMEAADKETGELIDDLPQNAQGLWKTIKLNLVRHIEQTRRL